MTGNKLIFVNLVLLFCASTLLMCLLLLPVPVQLEVHSLDGDVTITRLTSSVNVGQFMHEMKRDDGEKAAHMLTEAADDQPVSAGMTVAVRPAVARTATIAGKKKTVYLYPGTIEENLGLNQISYDEDDIISPKLTSQAKADTKLDVKEVHVDVDETTKTVKASDDVIFSASVPSGTIQSSEGSSGKGLYTRETTYVNGKKKNVKTKFVKWIEEPKNNQLVFGTSATGESGTVKYTRIFTAETTAYYAGKNAHGALGTSCYYGTCAVDPTVIPYGTKLYVEGYGTAIANDCGGAVKGNIVDLYMNSTRQCILWGRRYVTAYVLE